MIPRRGRRSYDRIRVVLSKILVRGIINPFIGPCLACCDCSCFNMLVNHLCQVHGVDADFSVRRLDGESFQILRDDA
jgi:hypothetical protein